LRTAPCLPGRFSVVRLIFARQVNDRCRTPRDARGNGKSRVSYRNARLSGTTKRGSGRNPTEFRPSNVFRLSHLFRPFQRPCLAAGEVQARRFLAGMRGLHP